MILITKRPPKESTRLKITAPTHRSISRLILTSETYTIYSINMLRTSDSDTSASVEVMYTRSTSSETDNSIITPFDHVLLDRDKSIVCNENDEGSIECGICYKYYTDLNITQCCNKKEICTDCYKRIYNAHKIDPARIDPAKLDPLQCSFCRAPYMPLMDPCRLKIKQEKEASEEFVNGLVTTTQKTIDKKEMEIKRLNMVMDEKDNDNKKLKSNRAILLELVKKQSDLIKNVSKHMEEKDKTKNRRKRKARQESN